MGAPLPFVPGAVKLVFNGHNSVNAWANVLHFTYAGSPPAFGDVLTLATVAAGEYAGNMMPLCPADSFFDNCVVTDLSSMTGAGAEAILTTAGTGGGAIIGAGTAALVSYPSSIRYRGGHPRQYLFIGQDSDLLNDCEWKTTSITTFSSAWLNTLAGFLGSTFGSMTINEQCAISYHNRYDNPVPPYVRAVPLVMPIPPGAFTISQTIASQRRRQRRG